LSVSLRVGMVTFAQGMSVFVFEKLFDSIIDIFKVIAEAGAFACAFNMHVTVG
jgi:hypothetical protein